MQVHAILLIHEKKNHSFFHLSQQPTQEDAVKEAYSKLQHQLSEALPHLTPSDLITLSYEFQPKFKESAAISAPRTEAPSLHPIHITVFDPPKAEEIQSNLSHFLNVITLLTNEYAESIEEKSCLNSLANRITNKYHTGKAQRADLAGDLPEASEQVLLQPIKKQRKVAGSPGHLA